MKSKVLIHVLIIFAFVVMLASCKKEPVPVDTNNLHISGYIYDENGRAKKDANISINNGRSTTTNEDGYFEVNGLTSGTYIMKVEKSLLDSSFSSLTDTIELNNNHHEFESLILPDPVTLNQPTEIKPSSIALSWSHSYGSDFREYRLYIGGEYHANILSDENGSLVYIGTNVTDTTFTISKENYNEAGGTISPNGTYCFRLYVFNEYGKISGSNILKVKTPQWDTTGFTVHYELEAETSFAGIEQIKGIDWDNNNNLWIFYFNATGYVNGNYVAEGEVLNYNYQEDKYLDTLSISGFEESPAGIAFDDNVIWVQMRSFNGQMKAFDIQSGQNTKTMMLSGSNSYLSDIAKTDEGFAALWNFHTYEITNNMGGIIRSGQTPYEVYGGMVVDLGIAARGQEYWIMSSRSNEIAIMDAAGNLIGIVKTGLNLDLGYGDDCRLAIRNNKLAIATSSHIYIYRIIQER